MSKNNKMRLYDVVNNLRISWKDFCKYADELNFDVKTPLQGIDENEALELSNKINELIALKNEEGCLEKASIAILSYLKSLHLKTLLFLKSAWILFLWFILRFLRIECSYEEVRKRRYEHPLYKIKLDLESTSSDSIDSLLSFAKDIYKEPESRKSGMDSKVKTLLPLISVLLPVSSFLIPKDSAAIWWWSLPLLFLTFAILLLSEYLNIGVSHVISFEEKLTSLDNDEVKKELITQYVIASNENEGRIDYLVDVFRAARRAFVVALVLFTILGIFRSSSVNSFRNSITRTNKEHSCQTVYQLRNTKVCLFCARLNPKKSNIDSALNRKGKLGKPSAKPIPSSSPTSKRSQ